MISDLKSETEDLNYFKQQLLFKGLPPDQINKMDYFELLEMLKAKPKEERSKDADDVFKSFGN